MHKRGRRIMRVIAFLALVILIWGGFHDAAEKKKQWEEKNRIVLEYKEESLEKINKSVFTLPEDQAVVGLVDGKGSYTSKQYKIVGQVTVKSDFIQTKFVQGVFDKVNPRMDAVVPVYVSVDSNSGSMYLVLYNIGEDNALEKSYARLGGKNIIFDKIEIIDSEKKNQDYQVKVNYRSEGIETATGKMVSKQKEVTIPVIDGHFDPTGTISK